jgi:hypothetical protein
MKLFFNKKNYWIILFFIIFISKIITQKSNDVIMVQKNITKLNENEFKISINYKSVGETGRISNIQIRDSLPNEFILIKGELVTKEKDPSAEWRTYSYIISKNIDPKLFSLDNRTITIELPPAEISYIRNKNNLREFIETENIFVSFNLKDEVIIKGGWLIKDPFINDIIVFLFSFFFPILFAILSIYFYQQYYSTTTTMNKSIKKT